MPQQRNRWFPRPGSRISPGTGRIWRPVPRERSYTLSRGTATVEHGIVAGPRGALALTLGWSLLAAGPGLPSRGLLGATPADAAVRADGEPASRPVGVHDAAARREDIGNVSRPESLERILRSKLMPAARAASIAATARRMAASGVPRGSLGVDSRGVPDPYIDISRPSEVSISGAVPAPKAGGAQRTALLYMTFDGVLKCRLYPRPSCNEPEPAASRVPPGGAAAGREDIMVDLGANVYGLPPWIEVDERPAALALPRDRSAADAAGAALYAGRFPAGADQTIRTWYLKFRLRIPHAELISSPWLVFSEPAGEGSLPPADLSALRLGGLSAAELREARRVRLEPLGDYLHVPAGRRPAEGAVAVFDAPRGGEAGCIGVVLWWGMSREQALARCRAKK